MYTGGNVFGEYCNCHFNVSSLDENTGLACLENKDFFNPENFLERTSVNEFYFVITEDAYILRAPYQPPVPQRSEIQNIPVKKRWIRRKKAR